MKIVCLVLAFCVISGASAMESKVLSKEPEETTMQDVVTKFPAVGTILSQWGFIETYYLPPNSNKTITTSFPVTSEAASLLMHVLSCWDVSDDEDLVIDLCTWVFADTETIKALIGGAKKNGSIDYDQLKKLLKRDFESYRSSAFTMLSQKGSCILWDQLVSFFPFLSACKNFDGTFSLSEPVSKQALIFLKKSLAIMYNFSTLHTRTKSSFDEINELVGTKREKYLKKKLISALLGAGFDPFELGRIAHFLQIKPLSKALLKLLNYHDFETARAIVSNISMVHFPHIVELMGKSNFIACLIALKLSLEKNQGETPFMSEFLEALVDSIYRLKLQPGIVHPLVPARGKKLFEKIHQSDRKKILFYEIFDSQMQELFKKLLLNRFSIPSHNFHMDAEVDKWHPNLLNLPNVCRADHAIDRQNGYEDIYFFSGDGQFIPFFVDAQRLADDGPRILKDISPVSCAGRFTLGNTFKTNWYMVGTIGGEVHIGILGYGGNKGIRVTIYPQSHWGAVTALCDTSSALIVAYKSGAVERYDLTKFSIDYESQPITLYADGRDKKCPPYCSQLESGSLSINEGKKAMSEDCCHLLQANDTYSVGAYAKGRLRVWKDNKLESLVQLPGSRDITTIRFLKNNQVAVGCGDGTVYVIALEDGKIVTTFEVKNTFYKKAVTALCCLGEQGRFLAVGYKNARVCIWDLETKNLVTTVEKNTDATVVGLFQTERGSSTLEIIYSNGVIQHFFIMKCASLDDLITELRYTNFR